MISASRISSIAVGAAICGAALTGYARDGFPEAALWALACVGCVHLLHRLREVRRRVGVSGAAEEVGVPADLDAALRGLAHDLRSPIAAATAAFAAFDERVGTVARDEDATYFRGAVQRNLDEARERLMQLERHRLGLPPDAQGPGMRAASAKSRG